MLSAEPVFDIRDLKPLTVLQGVFGLRRAWLLALCCTLLPALLPTLTQAQTPPQPQTSLPQLIATVLVSHPAVQGQLAQRNTSLNAQM